MFPSVVLFAMLWPVLLFVQAVVSRDNGPYRYGVEAEGHLRTRQLQHSAIVSGLPVDGAMPFRLEIRELEKKHEQWTLYILALSWIQYIDQEDPFSFYKVAGVHGAPFTDWGGVPALPGNDKEGYCHHVSNLFPPWHRPYLALMEQTLWDIMQFIATLYPKPRRQAFVDAARTFRLPYWDFAVTPQANSSVLPWSVGGAPDMDVDGPNGVQTIANPLFSYTFKPLNSSAFAQPPFDAWTETKRAPRPLKSVTAISNNSAVAQMLDSHLPSNQQRLYNLFANENYSTWSNEAWVPWPGDNPNFLYDSVESLHDTIHLACGGGYGHMAIIAYSSFDPVFWLTHTMIDRVFAMWQVMHDSSYVQPTAAIMPTRTIYYGDIQDQFTPLTPFRQNETHFWTAQTVRYHEVFNYTYAEVAMRSRADVIAAVNRLYTTYSPARVSTQRARSPPYPRRSSGENTEWLDMVQVKEARDLAWTRKPSRLPLKSYIIRDGFYNEWITNIRVNKFALKSSFRVYAFIGQVPGDTSSWDLAANLAGSLGVFAGAPSHSGDRLVGGTIPLTSALMELVSLGSISSLDADEVEAFLKNNLELRVVRSDGVAVDAEGVDGFRVEIRGTEVQAPQNEHKLPCWGDTISRFDLFG